MGMGGFILILKRFPVGIIHIGEFCFREEAGIVVKAQCFVKYPVFFYLFK